MSKGDNLHQSVFLFPWTRRRDKKGWGGSTNNIADKENKNLSFSSHGVSCLAEELNSMVIIQDKKIKKMTQKKYAEPLKLKIL